MILCMTTDDIGIVEEAYADYDQRVFGIPYCYLSAHNYRGLLDQGEDLFISAHGNDDEIGNAAGAPAYTPQQLAAVLNNYVLPGNYRGRIFVSACGSAPVYVNNLRAALGGAYAGRVFGMYGDIDYSIAAPGVPPWVRAS
ncbi:hypothetical protein [Paucibacter soli]|uniref:hypothetical protein n=1 Tax=Paucibacter soli TaxID=3133433 RepID=UPI00309FE029